MFTVNVDCKCTMEMYAKMYTKMYNVNVKCKCTL